MKRFNDVDLAAPTARLIAELPKAELHLHLDGALRVGTALELAATRDVDAPRTYEEMFRVLVAGSHLSSQSELLRAFELPVALVQDAEALERVTVELIEAKAADRVGYMQIRWAPLLHTRRGLSPADASTGRRRSRTRGCATSCATVV